MRRRKGYFKKDRATKIGEELTKLRISQGLTQEEVGNRLRRSKSYICRLETGKRNIPSDVLVGFASACGARPEYILIKSHQLQLPLLNAIIAPTELPVDPLNDITNEEREELISYLAFLRLKKTKVDLLKSGGRSL